MTNLTSRSGEVENEKGAENKGRKKKVRVLVNRFSSTMAEIKDRGLATVCVPMGAGGMDVADVTRASEQAKTRAWMLRSS